MYAYEDFKILRENTGLSIRKFAEECNISPRSLTYYENGTRLLTVLPVSKCITIFDKLGSDIPAFFYLHFPLKNEANKKIEVYNTISDYSYSEIHQKVFNRIMQIKHREQIEKSRLEEIDQAFNNAFDLLSIECSGGIITRELYIKHVLPVLFEIRIGNETLSQDNIFDRILEKLYRTDYSLKDLADICDISLQHLSSCKRGIYDMMQLRIDSALKICYVLDLDFNSTFR